MPSPEFDPATVAGSLKPKLAKRLMVLAKGHTPWRQAMKKHRQLEELGLVHEGTDGTQDVAVISDDGMKVAAVLRELGW